MLAVRIIPAMGDDRQGLRLPGQRPPNLGQDGDEELRQRKFFHFNLALPASIRVDSCASLILFISLAELEIPAVGEAQILSSRGDNRVIA